MRQLLDLKGLKCPMPALKTARLLAQIESGSEIEVICTDPMSEIDIPHLVQSEGHRLVSQNRHADHFVFLIRKA
jgi:tRNA 2-thiouridine synthesizing protein A